MQLKFPQDSAWGARSMLPAALRCTPRSLHRWFHDSADGSQPPGRLPALWEGAFGTKNAVADTLVKPRRCCWWALAFASARGGVVNIGGEGQMIAGAGRCRHRPGVQRSDPTTVIVACLVASFVAGAVWGGIAGVLKAYFSVNEILSTIMLNQIATFGMMYLVRSEFIDPRQKSAAAPIPKRSACRASTCRASAGRSTTSTTLWASPP